MTSIVEVIQHYQRSIDSSQDNEARLLHCINKLYKLPIKVEHLQETGVGKTVNSLRKFNGEIGVAAKTLVTKWKAMVAAEEEPMETSSQLTESETHNDTNGDGGGSSLHDDEEDENHNRHNKSQQNEHSRNHSREDKEKDRNQNRSSSNDHKDSTGHARSTPSDHPNSGKPSRHSNDKHKSSSSSSKEKSSCNKDKDGEKEKTEHKRSKEKHKERDHDKEKERNNRKKSSSHTSNSKSNIQDKKQNERSDKHKSSSKDKERTKDSTSSKEKHDLKSSSSSSTSKSSTKDPDNDERKRRYNSDNDSNDFKSPQPKMAKVHKSTSSKTATKSDSSSSPAKATEQEERDESFDSSMGANFDDVLGMLNMPVKNSKKTLKSPSTPANSSSTSKKDINTQKRSTSSSSNNSSDIANKVNGEQTASSYSTQFTSKAMKPDLLAPTAKLEPLDPSIALELPTISTNYKPMPLNQTVMDCVFNNSSSSSKPVRTLSDAEAITHGISSKTMRTKIYSGVRTGQTFQVPSLFDMCIRILQKNIDALEYTGGVPFEVLKPVLERATPQQLYVFEEYNPYLMEDSDVLWQQHVARNFRTKKRLENESWREMFIRCQEDEERRLSVLKDSIKASQKIAAAPIRKTQLAFVDSMVKPPRNVLKKQEQFGTKGKLVATPAARVASLSSVTPNAAKTGDQRLKVPTAVRDNAQVSNSSIRPKKAPLMQKTLQFIRGRHKR